ncbi:MAG: hypothetical protein ACXVYY_00065 [Oryzihumus sp.]
MSAQTTTAHEPTNRAGTTVTTWLATVVTVLAVAVVVLAVQLSSLRDEVDTLPRDTSTDTSSLSFQLDRVCRLLGSVAGSAKVHDAFTGQDTMDTCEQAATEAASGHPPR